MFMQKLSTKDEKHIGTGKAFSIFHGFRFFLKMNVFLVIAIGMFLMNQKHWGTESTGDMYAFILFAEAMIFLFSLVACFHQPNVRDIERKIEIAELLGLILALGISTLFFTICFQTVAPFPSSTIFGILATNILVGFYSILFPKVTIYIYEANVVREHKSLTSYLFKYIAILFSGLTYQVLVVLQRLPFLVNRLFIIVYTAVIILLLFTTGRLFE